MPETRNKIITEIYDDKQYLQMCKYVSNYKDYEDLHSIMLEAVCKMPEDKLSEIYERNEIKRFCCGIIINQAYSKSSKFYYEFKLFREKRLGTDFNENHMDDLIESNPDLYNELIQPAESNELTEEEIINLKNKIEKIISEMHWYDQRIFWAYFEVKSFRKLSKKTKINYTTIWEIVQKVKNHVKKELKEK